MTTIELTDDQRQALQAEQGKPIDVVDPATHQRYVLIACEQYERVRALLEQGTGQESPAAAEGIPPGILRSQQAFWRDLPELLQNKRNRGKWVCYHGDERIGIGKYEDLIRECLRRGLADDTYDLDVIEPRAIPPWEPEEIEGGGHEVDEIDDVSTNTGDPT
jgi:hypothetical protein